MPVQGHPRTVDAPKIFGHPCAIKGEYLKTHPRQAQI